MFKFKITVFKIVLCANQSLNNQSFVSKKIYIQETARDLPIQHRFVYFAIYIFYRNACKNWQVSRRKIVRQYIECTYSIFIITFKIMYTCVGGCVTVVFPITSLSATATWAWLGKCMKILPAHLTTHCDQNQITNT